MTFSSILLDNIPDIFNITSSLMKGGKSVETVYQPSRRNPFMIFIIILLMILLKGLIVYLLYNSLVPKLIYSLSNNKRTQEDIINNFRTLSYSESVLLVILFNTLFTF
jgi:hypothetical protein